MLNQSSSTFFTHIHSQSLRSFLKFYQHHTNTKNIIRLFGRVAKKNRISAKQENFKFVQNKKNFNHAFISNSKILNEQRHLARKEFNQLLQPNQQLDLIKNDLPNSVETAETEAISDDEDKVSTDTETEERKKFKSLKSKLLETQTDLKTNFKNNEDIFLKKIISKNIKKKEFEKFEKQEEKYSLFSEFEDLSKKLSKSLVNKVKTEFPHVKKQTMIQARSMPVVMDERNASVVIAAETGCGKTLAYVLPIVEMITQQMKEVDFGKEEEKAFQAIVVCPSIELCRQTKTVFNKLFHSKNLTCAILDDKNQKQNFKSYTHKFRDKFYQKTNRILSKNSIESIEKNKKLNNESVLPSVLVTTPQKLVESLTIDLALSCRQLVFDEVDMMLVSHESVGYQPQLRRILSVFNTIEKDKLHISVPYSLTKTRFILVGATIGRRTARRFLHETETMTKKQTNRLSSLHEMFKGAVQIRSPYLHHNLLPLKKYEDEIIQPTTSWHLVRNERDHDSVLLDSLGVHPLQKRRVRDATVNMITSEQEKGSENEKKVFQKNQTIVFCNETETVERLNTLLTEEGLECAMGHEKMESDDRQQQLNDFMEGKFQVFIATDLFSRGIDFPRSVDHIFQYEFARNVTVYLHRIGRTCRAGNKQGKVTNLYIKRDERLVNAIRQGSKDMSAHFHQKKIKRERKKEDNKQFRNRYSLDDKDKKTEHRASSYKRRRDPAEGQWRKMKL